MLTTFQVGIVRSGRFKQERTLNQNSSPVTGRVAVCDCHPTDHIGRRGESTRTKMNVQRTVRAAHKLKRDRCVAQLFRIVQSSICFFALLGSPGMATEYEMLHQTLTATNGQNLSFSGSIHTDGTTGAIGPINITGLSTDGFDLGGLDLGGDDDLAANLTADATSIALPLGGYLHVDFDRRQGQAMVTDSLSWSETNGHPTLSYRSSWDDILVSDGIAMPSRYIAVAKQQPLIRPVDQTRFAHAAYYNVSCGNHGCDGDEDSDFEASIDFRTTHNFARAGEWWSNESSTIGSNFISATGRLYGSWEPFGAPSASQEAHSRIQFQLAQPTTYNLDGNVYGGTAPRIVFSGPGGMISELNVGEFGVSNSLNSRGILSPGTYELSGIADNEIGWFDIDESYGATFRVAPLPSEFHPIASISSNSPSDHWPASNLIQGPQTGHEGDGEWSKIAEGADGNWVTGACGFPCDYFESNDAPVLTIDLGEDRLLTEIDVWGYDGTNANGMSEFSLRFATAAEGSTGFGQSIDYNPTFSGLVNDSVIRQPLLFERTVAARFVELTATDNFFVAPGDGSGGETPGGDRVGLGEIAFPISSSVMPLVLTADFDGNGSLDTNDIQLLVRRIRSDEYVIHFDLNSDNKLNAEDIRAWVTDYADTWIGDANLDGEFNSSDFVFVFESGQYEDTMKGNSTWATGDFNGDGEFNTGDLVFAFQDGGYEKGPRIVNAHAVPEPNAGHILSLAILLLASRGSFRGATNFRRGIILRHAMQCRC
jgi:hypothetical protein